MNGDAKICRLMILALAFFVAACSERVPQNSAEPASAPKMIPLKLELPPYGACHLPRIVSAPNLESKLNCLGLDVMIPEDATNIALRKPVTSSEKFPLLGGIEMVTDGAKEGHKYVELSGGLQWVQIDFEKQCEIYAVALWHWFEPYHAYRDVVVQVSDDPEFKKGIATIFNNDHDNSSGLGLGTEKAWEPTYNGKVIVPSEPVKARYIRFYSNGSDYVETNAYCEVEVYGR